MATKNPRINVTINAETAGILAMMAKQKGKTVSMTANELIEKAIEDHEDAYWGKLAHERMKEGGPTLSSEEFWKDVL
jgi:predicted DNA-binding protein